MTDPLICALKNPEFYPHPVDNIQVIETHISWVLLTGPYAYKIKKPVDFGFLNFTSLKDRKHFCHEELRLNQRLTADLYLEVLPITGTIQAPQLNGDGPVLDYALKMRQFPQNQLLSEMQKNSELNAGHIDALAQQISQFHLQAPQVSASHPLTEPQAIMAPVRQNFEQIRAMLNDSNDLQQLDALEAWAEDSFARLLPLLEQRSHNGSIRECHGDIHLGNATVLDGQVTLFDCIEFNEPFRLIDVVSDAAFLAMDLEDRGLHSLANRFINAWLEQTNQYQALPLLNFYKAYRAMVRGKVNLFRLGQEQDPTEQAAILQQYRSYANLAESYCAIPARFLAITHGTSASGKSTVAMQLVESLGAVRIRSDYERKRLFGEQDAAQGNAVGEGIYNASASAATYQHIHELAKLALQSGYAVVLDATYLRADSRQQAGDVAQACGVPFLILDCHAPEAVVQKWLNERRQAGQDPSDATAEVIAAQQANREPLNAEEQLQTLKVQTDDANSMAGLVGLLKQRLPGF